VIGMAAVLEGHIQATSRTSRDPAADHSTICLSLTLLDMICPCGWIRDKEATDDMPRWIHQRTGAGQWDFPNLMKLETIILTGQPLQSSTMEDWSSRGAASWLPINSNIETLLRILLQNHPLGCLLEFRRNSMISLQQRSSSGTTLTPLFFNQGDTIDDRVKRKISHLMYRAAELQIPGTYLRSGYAYPCQDPKNHPIRTGISQRPTLVNELELSTSFTLTVYTIPYPQGHQGLQCEGNPPASIPFLFHKDDALPVYYLMHQTYSDDRHRHHISEALVIPNPAASDTEEIHKPPTDPTSRKVWGPDSDILNDTPFWQRAILIQDGRAPGFPQAPIPIGQGFTIENEMEAYKGHILEVQIKAKPGETVGSAIQKALLKCYPQSASVPAPHTLRYTLGDFPSHAVRTQEQAPADSPRVHTIFGAEISLSHDDKLEWITIEDSTIIAFLPNPEKEEETEETHMPEQEGATENTLSNTLDQGDSHQIFVRIPDTYTEKGRRPAYTQTVHTKTSLDSLKEELSLLLAIPTHSFRIHHGGRTLTNQSTLEQQGVLRDMTVWMIIGGLFGGADTRMGDSPD